MTGAEILATFRADHGFEDDGGASKWFDRGSLFGMPVPILNSSHRAALIPYHDFHHWLAGCGVDELGEAEVSAWTLGTGGGPFLGRVYDLGALTPGVVRAPRRMRGAFLRGRAQRNVYGVPLTALLAMQEDALRTHARVDAAPAPWDRAARWHAIGLALAWCATWLTPIGPTCMALSLVPDLLRWTRTRLRGGAPLPT